jgi:hypothetical protein
MFSHTFTESGGSMGRPRKPDARVTLSVRLHPYTANRLAELAAEYGATRSRLIEFLISMALEAGGKDVTKEMTADKWHAEIRRKFAETGFKAISGGRS